MIRFPFVLLFSLSTALALWGVTAHAQQLGGRFGGLAPAVSGPARGPAINPRVPSAFPHGNYQWSSGNPAGTVTNTRRGLIDEDANRRLREHVVTNPRGEMVQTWDRSRTEDGYLFRRSQTWTDADGNPVRSHQWSMAGSDPYNSTRQQDMTFRDGRTMEHSQVRSWDGTTATMEHSFVGPNGQTRTFQRAWSPGEFAGGRTPAVEAGVPALGRAGRSMETAAGDRVPREIPRSVVKRPNWLQRLNPFHWDGPAGSELRRDAKLARRWGFTIGAGSSESQGPSPQMHGLGRNSPGSPAARAGRPAWAGPKPSISSLGRRPAISPPRTPPRKIR